LLVKGPATPKLSGEAETEQLACNVTLTVNVVVAHQWEELLSPVHSADAPPVGFGSYAIAA
jgi:hypothetical protein